MTFRLPEVIGWILVHSVWQFAVLSVAAAVLCRVLRNATASVRYAVLLMTLAAMTACPAATWLSLSSQTQSADTSPVTTELQIVSSSPRPSDHQGNTTRESAARFKSVEPVTTPTLTTPAVVQAETEMRSTQRWFKVIAVALQPWLTVITTTWCVGVFAFTLRLVLGWWHIEYLKRRRVSMADNATQRMLRVLMDRLNIRRTVRLLTSELIDSPVVVGCLRSVILIPSSLVSGIPTSQLEAILAHELVHVRRCDYAVNLIQSVMETVFFYHPAVWWLSNHIRAERENCCDDQVVAVLHNKMEYSRALLAIEEFRSHTAGLALTARSGSLVTRIRRLLAEPVDDASRSGSMVVVISMLATAMVTVAGVTMTTQADEGEAPNTDASSWTTRISDKLQVELVAVVPHKGGDSQAWRPDGQRFDQPPQLPAMSGNSQTDQTEGLNLVFRFTGLNETQHPGYVSDSLQFRYWPHPDTEGRARVLAVAESGSTSASFQVGIPDPEPGPLVRVSTDGQADDSVDIPAKSQQAYQTIKPFRVQRFPQQTHLVWKNRHNSNIAEATVLAVDKAGRHHRRVGATIQEIDGQLCHADVFSLPMAQIEHFEYRLRAYRHWVTFSNVALQADNQTETTVSTRTVAFARANDADTEDTVRVYGKLTGSAETSVAGAEIHARTYDGQQIDTTTDAAGNFEFSVPTKSSLIWIVAYGAQQSAMGVASVFNSSQNAGERQGIDTPLEIKLLPIAESRVTVVDSSGSPVADATVVVQTDLTEVDVLTTDKQGRVSVRVPENSRPMVIAFKSGIGYDYFSSDVRDKNNYPVKNPPKLPNRHALVLNGARTVRIQAVDTQGNPVQGVRVDPWYVNKGSNPGRVNFASRVFEVTTDDQGKAVFDWLPPNVDYGVTFWTRSEQHDADRLDLRWDRFDENSVYRIVLKKLTPISGRVINAAEQPVSLANIAVNGQGVGDLTRLHVTTDTDGRFSLNVPPEKCYIAHVTDGDSVGYASGIIVRENKPVTDIEIKLQPGTIISGVSTRGMPPKPVAGDSISLKLNMGRIPPEIQALRAKDDNRYYEVSHFAHRQTNAKGKFRFVAAPGKYVLFGPRQTEPHEFTITDQKTLELSFHVARPELMQFTGTVTDPNGNPVAGANVLGYYSGNTHGRSSFSGTADAQGQFQIERETQPATVRIMSPDSAFGCVFEIDGDAKSHNAQLKPTYAATGRLMDDGGRPFADAAIKCGIRVFQGEKDNSAWMTAFAAKVKTDADGHYQLTDLVQDVEYDIDLERGERGPWSQIATANHTSSDLLDLGTKHIARQFGTPSLNSRAASAFRGGRPLKQRFDLLKHEAERDNCHIAVVTADAESEEARWIYRLLRGTSRDRREITDEATVRKLRLAMNDFRQLWIDTSQLKPLQEIVGNDSFSDRSSSAVILLKADGSFLGDFKLDLQQQPEKNLSALTGVIEAHQVPDRNAREVLQSAKQQAAREGKRILLQETATWCGPCHMLSRFIEKHRSVFDKHFVWVKIDRSRMIHGDTVMTLIRPGQSRGIPWTAVLDDQENLLASSNTLPDGLAAKWRTLQQKLAAKQKDDSREDQAVTALQIQIEELAHQVQDDNFGFPSGSDGAQRFLAMLKNSAPAMTEAEYNTLAKALLPQTDK